MESANLHYQHHHQVQQQQVIDQSSSPPLFASHSSSSSSSSSFHEVGTTRAAAWTPNTILNNSYFNPKINATSIIQDLGFGTTFTSLSAHELQLARIKQELSPSSSSDISNYPKFAAMLNSPSSSSTIELDSYLLHPSSSSCSYIQNDHQRDLLKTFSSGCQINGLHHLPAARGTFSQIFPTINISNFNQSASSSAVSSSSSLDMNLEALDLFNSVRFSGSLISSQPSQDYLGLLKSSLPYTPDNMQQQSGHRPSNSSAANAISSFHNGVPEVKRSTSFLETKAPQATPKKSRLDSGSSSSPFKVRKEKLGDRIASLQQLVAPFGKTDTASVLTEAIGYIKFLQKQIEISSVPYMKPSRNKTRKMQRGLEEDGQEEATRDLRSRGLCLVPLTCLSYVTAGGTSVGVWPPAGP